jgi:hypothetical protein
MSGTLLTQDEMLELTGSNRVSRQTAVLRESGIRFVRRADGKLTTTWEAVNAALAAHRPPPPPADGPKLDWMRKSA